MLPLAKLARDCQSGMSNLAGSPCLVLSEHLPPCMHRVNSPCTPFPESERFAMKCFAMNSHVLILSVTVLAAMAPAVVAAEPQATAAPPASTVSSGRESTSEKQQPSGNVAALPDLGLQPPRLIPAADYTPDVEKSSRGSQGVPAIERAANGRLWAAWYTGRGKRGVESPFSYVVLATSGDDGTSWTEKLVIRARKYVHTYDPCLWNDPEGRMWFFWAQSAGLQDGRMGVWAVVTENSGEENPRWTEPRRIANGVMLNKPTVLANGAWLLPAGLWRDNTGLPNIALDRYDLSPYTKEMLEHDLGEERGSNVYRSQDNGKTFERIGQARIPGTRVDEHMIVERRDGSLWMLLRNIRGIAQSVSTDGGRTWSSGPLYREGRKYANKRFFLRRLKSGALLLVRNNAPEGGQRTHLTAFVSDDEGQSWLGGLLLDERESSYPDGTEAEDGTIYVIYDHQRYTRNRDGKPGVGSVLLARFTEADVRAGKKVSATLRLQTDVTRLKTEAEVSQAAAESDAASPEQ